MDSNQIQRILTGIVLVPVVLGLVWFAPPQLFGLLAAIVALLALREYLDLADKSGLAPLRYPALLFGGLVVILQVLESPIPLELLLVPLLVMLAVVLAMRAPRDLAQSLGSAASTVLGVLYVAMPFGLLVALRQEPKGAYLVLYVLLLIWIGDTAAYYAGRAFGRHKLAPRISPGKTWEGTIASLAGSLVLGFFFVGHFFPRVPLWLNLITAVAVNTAGQAGDLAESALKRGAGVKDSGSFLPGHGGVLDRVDALLFAIPVLWYDIHLALGLYL